MGLFTLPFIGFLITPNNARVQVILGLNSQAKELWKALQYESPTFYFPQANAFPGHIWDKLFYLC